MGFYRNFTAAYKAARASTDPPFSGYGGQGFWNDANAHRLESLLRMFTGSRIDYEREVGDLSLSSLVMAASNWLGTNLAEAPLQVTEGSGKEKKTVIEEHILPELWARPNSYYSGEDLFKAFGVSWFIDGNVYLLKVRDRSGEVAELWYLPHFAVEPQWPIGGIPFISHYAYNVDGREYVIRREDIIHFRRGIDPSNPRKGMSPAAPVMRELFADHESANFSAQLLKNFGIPGVIISPKGERVSIKKEDRDDIKGDFQHKFSGDGRGSAMVLSGQIDVTTLSFDPEKMLMAETRKISEARWCAMTGIPAAVLGFTSGMEQTTVGATMMALRKQAYEDCLIPTQRIIGGSLTVQLLPEFEGEKTKRKVGFDNSEVQVLQEDRDKLYARINSAWVSDELTLDETREAISYAPDASGRGALYYSEIKAALAPKPVVAQPGADVPPPQLVNGKAHSIEAI